MKKRLDRRPQEWEYHTSKVALKMKLNRSLPFLLISLSNAPDTTELLSCDSIVDRATSKLEKPADREKRLL